MADPLSFQIRRKFRFRCGIMTLFRFFNFKFLSKSYSVSVSDPSTRRFTFSFAILLFDFSFQILVTLFYIILSRSFCKTDQNFFAKMISNFPDSILFKWKLLRPSPTATIFLLSTISSYKVDICSFVL